MSSLLGQTLHIENFTLCHFCMQQLLSLHWRWYLMPLHHRRQISGHICTHTVLPANKNCLIQIVAFPSLTLFFFSFLFFFFNSSMLPMFYSYHFPIYLSFFFSRRHRMKICRVPLIIIQLALTIRMIMKTLPECDVYRLPDQNTAILSGWPGRTLN